MVPYCERRECKKYIFLHHKFVRCPDTMEVRAPHLAAVLCKTSPSHSPTQHPCCTGAWARRTKTWLLTFNSALCVRMASCFMWNCFPGEMGAVSGIWAGWRSVFCVCVCVCVRACVHACVCACSFCCICILFSFVKNKDLEGRLFFF